MGTTFPDYRIEANFRFSKRFFGKKKTTNLSVSFITRTGTGTGIMSKLILVLCVFFIAVLAKPSRLRAKTDLRQMDKDDQTCGSTSFYFKAKRFFGYDYACSKASNRYFGCELRWTYPFLGDCWRSTDARDDAAYEKTGLTRPSWCYVIKEISYGYGNETRYGWKPKRCRRATTCLNDKSWALPCNVEEIFF